MTPSAYTAQCNGNSNVKGNVNIYAWPDISASWTGKICGIYTN